MAKCGNHGHVAPRDRALLYRLYIEEHRSLSDMGRMFGVTHRSMAQVIFKMGLALPGKGNRRRRRLCIDCGLVPPKTLPHKLTKNGTGTRCLECLRKYKAAWQKRATEDRPEVRARRKVEHDRWYYEGPINPKGESQWISKGRAILRSAKRVLKTQSVSQFPNEESAPAATSPA